VVRAAFQSKDTKIKIVSQWIILKM
jgi:hypothetical protein